MRLVAGMGRWCNRSGVGFNSRGERLAAGVVRAIGLMSGTSLDGVDVALIETDGERIVAFGPTGYRPYSDAEQALLRRALQQGAGLTDRGARPGVLAQAEAFVTAVHAATVEDFLSIERIDKSGIAAVGFHGQTVLHKPAARMLAERLRPATVETADAIGWSSQAIEAQAFAYLAVRTLNGLPITFSATTGVSKPLEGGIVAHPRS